MTVSKNRFRWNMLALYISFIGLFGPYGEIVVGYFYTWLFGHPLWQYHLLPVHSNYTSLIAPLIWGIAGCAMYFTHEHLLSKRKISLGITAVLFAVETITLEFIINASYWLVSGTYIFYYTPGEMLHFTSVQTLPFYFLAGIATTIAMRHFNRDPLFFSLLSVCFMAVLVFLAG